MKEPMTYTMLVERMIALPDHVVYGQITGRPEWAYEMQRLIPAHMRPGVLRWIAGGIRPGSFLSAVLENNLMEAYSRADSTNAACMRDYVIFLHNYAPSESYGSVEEVNKWKGLCIKEED